MPALTLLLPSLARLEKRAPMAQWLTRGDRLADARPGCDTALRECFEFIGTAVPAAALTRSLDANDAAGSAWLRADPCHVRADTVAVRMLACGDIGLTQHESDDLARALRPLFGDGGFPLEAARPDRWYLRCPQNAKLPDFADPDAVLGDDLMQHLPRGANERQWRHLLNEAQVILHNHPVNVRRAQRGLPTANSVWFWGAGSLPDWVRTRITHAVSDDPIVAALAKRAGIVTTGLDQAGKGLPSEGAVLVDAAALPPIDVRLFDCIDLLFASGERFRYKPWHRWRFWRRIRK